MDRISALAAASIASSSVMLVATLACSSWKGAVRTDANVRVSRSFMYSVGVRE